MPIVRVSRDAEAFADAAAAYFVESAMASVADRGTFSVALSGGSTPRAVFARVAADETARVKVSWRQVDWWWSDERAVPPADAASNFKMAFDALLGRVPIDPARVHRLKGEAAPAEAASEYERDLRAVFGVSAREIPRFDLVLLGLGADGHTASLFPGTSAIAERERLVVANDVPAMRTVRLTFTLPLINRARRVAFLVSGAEKSSILARAIEGPRGVLPAQLVSPDEGELVWFVDSAAARDLAAT
ncbi:MAG TPA: 6-phosphogluconolactonase [Vicinamibacterales bacterium]|nr:6-phosphogluconolactonase [Vicinamibacterales bacterium]